MFSHPSYSEALSYILLEYEEEKIPSDIYIEIFSKVLHKLASYSHAAEALAKVITINFDNMPEDAKRLLFTLADTKSNAEAVA